MASRRTQPYRKGSALRRPGGALSAILAGRTRTGINPQDVERRTKKKRRKKRRAFTASS